MIHVSHLYKSYGPVKALEDISFDVPEGAVIGFLGPNGAGKSTTLRILTGFLPGDRGTVQVAGCDVGQNSIALRSQIGYLPEGVPLYPEMRVNEYLKFRSRLKGIDRSQRKREIGIALEKVGITDVQKRIVGTLSKGYRQRVGLADALLGEPKVLILDEPTVGLDPHQLLQFRNLLSEVGKDRTVLLSTHILSEVDHVCDGAIIIQGGKIVAQDTSENLRKKVEGIAPISIEILGPSKQTLESLERLSEIERVEKITSQDIDSNRTSHSFRVWPKKGKDPREAIFQMVKSNNWTLLELHRESVSLEEVFLEIVGKGQTASNVEMEAVR